MLVRSASVSYLRIEATVAAAAARQAHAAIIFGECRFGRTASLHYS